MAKKRKSKTHQTLISWEPPPSREQLLKFVRALARIAAREDHERSIAPKRRKRVLKPPKRKLD